MTVYMLNILIYPKWEERNRGGAVNVARRYCSDVFSSIDKAVSAGTKRMAEGLEDLRKSMFEDKSIDDIANDEIKYDFIVFELDPGVKRDSPSTDLFSSTGNWVQYARWHYDYNGNLLYRVEKVEGLGSGIRMPGDDKEIAGTLFKRGDFVKLNCNHPDYEYFEDTVFVIGETPRKKPTSKFWENVYVLYYIGKNSRLYCSSRIDDIEIDNHIKNIHETRISAYDGEIPEEHPLQMIKKIVTGEVKVNQETWENILAKKRVIFDWQGDKNSIRSWRNINFVTE